MAEWRFGRGWSAAELRQRLRELDHLEPNFDGLQGFRAPEWRRQAFEQVVGHEPPGKPRPDAAFARATRIVQGYGFSDPRIVIAYFDPGRTLAQRRMLLELRVLGLHFLCGAAVAQVLSEQDAQQTTFGYRYDTLYGHLESGMEWFILTKDHRSGEVRFRIASLWRPGQYPNWWSHRGFRWLGPRYQAAWHELAFVRMRELIAARLRAEHPPHPATHTGRTRRSGRNGLFSSSAYNTAISDAYTTRTESVAVAAGLGVVSGMRSMLAPALVSARVGREPRFLAGHAGGRWLAAPRTRTALAAAAVGELCADKLPWIPPRTAPVSLTGRMVSAAVLGAALASRRATMDWAPVAAAATAAWAATHLSARARGYAARRLRLSQVQAGLLEDATALLLGAIFARRA